MPATDRPPIVLCGLSFSTADLTLASAWAEMRDLQLAIRLDHGTEAEEYEEVLAFSKRGTQVCSWIMWCNAEAVFLQPLIGRTRQYRTVADALDAKVGCRTDQYQSDALAEAGSFGANGLKT